MSMKNETKSTSGHLRQKAEDMLKKMPSKSVAQLSEADALKLIHELEVYQIELELQQEELMWAEEQTAKIAVEETDELFDLAQLGYFKLSKEGEILAINRYGSQMLGKEHPRLINSRLGFFISEDTKPGFHLFLDKVFSSHARVSCEVTLTTKSKLPTYVSLSGIAAENGAQCLVAMIDITERKLAGMQLKRINEELSKTNAEKDKFFSVVAHDLRSPFNGFLGLTEILVNGLRDMSMDEIQKMAVAMRKSAVNLFSLLGNLLEWSSMQRNLTPFVPESVLLRQKISESILLILEATDKKGISISYDIPEDMKIIVDENMFGTIIRNLVSNAVKFTQKGGNVVISARETSDKSVNISVIDSGIGMNKNMIDHLFQLDVNTNRKGTEGEVSTGLGLIICKDFIEKHNGKFWVESEEGKGSVFRFTIPSNRKIV